MVSKRWKLILSWTKIYCKSQTPFLLCYFKIFWFQVLRSEGTWGLYKGWVADVPTLVCIQFKSFVQTLCNYVPNVNSSLFFSGISFHQRPHIIGKIGPSDNNHLHTLWKAAWACRTPGNLVQDTSVFLVSLCSVNQECNTYLLCFK